MLKKISIKKLTICAAVLFALLLIYLIPKEEVQLKQNLEYVDLGYNKVFIYLLDSQNYLGKTNVLSEEETIEDKIKELINTLIIGGPNESKIPTGFKALIPADTKILELTVDQSLVKINFSKEFLDTNEETEEKIIESIVYTLTEINGINEVIIYVEGQILSKLPESNTYLPSVLTRDFGINKQYNLTSTKNIDSVTIYYIDKVADVTYYVPVTKYVNSTSEKIDIIVDELSSSNITSSNLMSYLSHNAKILAVENSNNILTLDFNEYIFSNHEEKDILEEVLYTISMSVFDNYEVEEVVFLVNGEEIYKSASKTID